MMVINGGYPGPTIEANWGDWIEITVTNELDEGTSLHWHGLIQRNTVCFERCRKLTNSLTKMAFPESTNVQLLLAKPSPIVFLPIFTEPLGTIRIIVRNIQLALLAQ
jgi:Multicopper oxidase